MVVQVELLEILMVFQEVILQYQDQD